MPGRRLSRTGPDHGGRSPDGGCVNPWDRPVEDGRWTTTGSESARDVRQVHGPCGPGRRLQTFVGTGVSVQTPGETRKHTAQPAPTAAPRKVSVDEGQEEPGSRSPRDRRAKGRTRERTRPGQGIRRRRPRVQVGLPEDRSQGLSQTHDRSQGPVPKTPWGETPRQRRERRGPGEGQRSLSPLPRQPSAFPPNPTSPHRTPSLPVDPMAGRDGRDLSQVCVGRPTSGHVGNRGGSSDRPGGPRRSHTHSGVRYPGPSHPRARDENKNEDERAGRAPPGTGPGTVRERDDGRTDGPTGGRVVGHSGHRRAVPTGVPGPRGIK